MVIEHPSVERARKGYEALAAGDMDIVSSVFADDMVWHVPGGNLLSGTYRGKAEGFGFGSVRLSAHGMPSHPRSP